ncbi:MAG: response regulator transcription factor [Acidobacteriota bacterium]|jgi:DNA-binding NarL/FixJ family response regulator
MSRPRVLLADDHKIVLEGLRSLLEPQFDLVGTAKDGRELLEAAVKLDPDVIVVDISMPLLNGIEAIRKLKKDGCRARVIFLTMHADVTYAIRAFEAGASGFVLKHSASTELVEAIREALEGRSYLTSIIPREAVFRDGSEPRSGQVDLTPRQREVLQLVAEGRSAREIAGILKISPRTVEFHKYRMMEELQVQTNAELIQYAIKHGIASL